MRKRVTSVATFGEIADNFVLKVRRNPTKTERGLSFSGQPYETVTSLQKIDGKYGQFLGTKLNEGEKLDEVTTYTVGDVKDFKGTANSPVAFLKVSVPGEDAVYPCNLFVHTYDDGTTYLKGVDRDNLIEYRVYCNKAKSEKASA